MSKPIGDQCAEAVYFYSDAAISESENPEGSLEPGITPQNYYVNSSRSDIGFLSAEPCVSKLWTRTSQTAAAGKISDLPPSADSGMPGVGLVLAGGGVALAAILSGSLSAPVWVGGGLLSLLTGCLDVGNNLNVEPTLNERIPGDVVSPINDLDKTDEHAPKFLNRTDCDRPRLPIGLLQPSFFCDQLNTTPAVVPGGHFYMSQKSFDRGFDLSYEIAYRNLRVEGAVVEGAELVGTCVVPLVNRETGQDFVIRYDDGEEILSRNIAPVLSRDGTVVLKCTSEDGEQEFFDTRKILPRQGTDPFKQPWCNIERSLPDEVLGVLGAAKSCELYIGKNDQADQTFNPEISPVVLPTPRIVDEQCIQIDHPVVYRPDKSQVDGPSRSAIFGLKRGRQFCYQMEFNDRGEAPEFFDGLIVRSVLLSGIPELPRDPNACNPLTFYDFLINGFRCGKLHVPSTATSTLATEFSPEECRDGPKLIAPSHELGDPTHPVEVCFEELIREEDYQRCGDWQVPTEAPLEFQFEVCPQ